jgi:Zn-dependent protease
MLTNLFSNPSETIFFLIALLIAITIHEFAHAWAATYLGDPTPGQQGRLSLNPLRHLDPLGTIFLFLAGFGWGKPVITDPRYYKRPQRDYALTSLAGPAANLLLAIIFSLPATIATILGHSIDQIPVLKFTEIVYDANFFLFVFNLLPIYPLDGSKLVMAFIKNQRTMYNFISLGPKILFLLLIINLWIPIFSWYFIISSTVVNLIIRGIPVSLFT